MAQLIDLRKKLVEESLVEEADTLNEPASLILAENDFVEVEEPRTEEFAGDNAIPDDSDAIRWQGPISEHHPDMKAVWVMTSVLFLVSIIVFVFQQNIFSSILFLLLGIMLLVHVRHDVEIADFDIDYVGIKVGDRLYRYNEIESFWIEYSPKENIKELSLHLKKNYMPYLKIPLYEQNPVQIRSFMIDFIPEQHHPDNLTHILARRLGI